MYRKFLCPIFFLLLFVGLANAQSHLQPGIWRGELTTKSGNTIPFVFDVRSIGTKQQIFIHNAS